MRRRDREIADRGEMLEILRGCDVCSVAFNDDGAPYVIEMNFGLLDEEKPTLCFHCAGAGRKLELLRRDDRVGFFASRGHRLEWQDGGRCTMRYESVAGRGRMRVAEGGEKRAAMERLMAHYRPETAHAPGEPSWLSALDATTVLLLDAEEMSGKRSAAKD